MAAGSPSTNQFTIKLVSFNGSGSAGNVTNFDNNSSYSWTVASVGGSVTNFDPAAFNIDTSSFSNDLAGGQFLAQAGSLNILFTNNHAGGHRLDFKPRARRPPAPSLLT
jgi:hypothetical protein